MNFSGLPDNYKPGTRGRAPDATSNNIFGTYQETNNSRNNNTFDQHAVRGNQASDFNQANEAANQLAHDKVMHEAQVNKNRMKQQSNIFGETTPQDFHRNNPYQNPYGQQMQANDQVNRNQSNQTRHQSHIFDEQRQAPQKMNQKRQGFNPITGEDY